MTARLPITIKLGDFGISHTLKEVREGKVNFKSGTTPFMAPEQIMFQHRQEWISKFSDEDLTKIDVFQLGVVLFLLRFKDFPFEGGCYSKVEYRQPNYLKDRIKFLIEKQRASHIPDPFKQTSDLFVNLISSMLTFNVKQRLSVHQLKKHRFFNHYGQLLFKNEADVQREVFSEFSQKYQYISNVQRVNIREAMLRQKRLSKCAEEEK